MKKLILLFLAAFVFSAQNITAQTSGAMNAAEIKLALNKLGKLCSVLYIGAHPDDENSAVLAYSANEMQCRTAYLSLTRGEAGDNLLGKESGAILGVIRTQESLAARRIDGAEQFFTRAIDFGFSRSAEEAFQKWNKQEVLSDVVWMIRKFRPDVIITRFPPDARAGDGQHIASAILAAEAFKLAGDEKVFPGPAWQPKRLLWNAFVGEGDTSPANAISIDVGKFNPLLGKSYTEMGAESRAKHKSQVQRNIPFRDSQIEYFAPVAGEPAKLDMLEGIKNSWSQVNGGDKIQSSLEQVQSSFNPDAPFEIIPLLTHLGNSSISPSSREGFIAFNKGYDVAKLVRACSGLWFKAIIDDPITSPGDERKINVTLINRSPQPFLFNEAEMNWDARGYHYTPGGMPKRELAAFKAYFEQIPIKVISDAPVTQPYWLRYPTRGYLQELGGQELIEESHTELNLYNSVTVSMSTSGVIVGDRAPVVYGYIDPVRGETYQPFVVAPPVVVSITQPLIVFTDFQPKPVRVVVRANRKEVEGTVWLYLPQGWRIIPHNGSSDFHFDLNEKNDEAAFNFIIAPYVKEFDKDEPDIMNMIPSKEPITPQNGSLQAVVFLKEKGSTREYYSSQITIDYPHIPKQTLFLPAESKLVKIDIKTVPTRIGYIKGSGDEIPDNLRQLGYNVRLLSDEDLQSLDLTANFDTIITGIRAYNVRETLKKQNQRLLNFVKNGGRMIVQYNTNDQTLLPNFAPFPLKLSSDRVTIEEAPVKFLNEQNDLLNFPNKITDKEFEGWVQERGAYLAGEFDRKNYIPVLEMHDPGEADKNGSLLIANYGKGKFIYTGIAFFRQLPAGVAGAYRLFVNLISKDK